MIRITLAALERRARADADHEPDTFNVHDRHFAERLVVHEARTEADRWSMVVRPARG